MTKQLTNTPQQSLRELIADDSYVAGFQTVGQYRAALLRHHATHPAVGAVTNNQITAGAATDAHDAIERAAPDCTCPSGDGSLRWPCAAHPPAGQALISGERHEGGAA